jgi:hypothetical protein
LEVCLIMTLRMTTVRIRGFIATLSIVCSKATLSILGMIVTLRITIIITRS